MSLFSLTFVPISEMLDWYVCNCMRSAAVGKAAMVLIYWQDAAYSFVIPERQLEFAQLYKYDHQSNEWQASLKAASVKRDDQSGLSGM